VGLRVLIASGMGVVLLLAAGTSTSGAQSGGPVYVVAPGGNDSGSGTADQPWRTISHAAQSVPPGAIVDIRAGTYSERVLVHVSGTATSPIRFQAHPGEHVTISGAGMRGLRGDAGLIQVDGHSNLEFVGLELRSLVDTHRRFTPAGVWIKGASSNITLRGLDVHDVRTLGRGNAHGIAVYGTSGSSPITGITIENSAVHDLKLGSSEAVVVNGNVAGWRIAGNTIDHVDNIGVDAIGFEGTAPSNDRARDGVIADNVVTNVDTKGNPAYDTRHGHCRCAGGIYVDGGERIVVERNRVIRANLGVELASEAHRGSTSDVVLRDNLITLSGRAGLTMGGYDTKRGSTERVLAVNNTLVANDQFQSGTGEIELNYKVLDCSFINNIVAATPRALMVTNGFRQNSGNVFDGDVWFAPGKSAGQPTWAWKKKSVKGFDAWRTATGGDSHGRYADPLLGADGRPGPGSPAIDAGIPTSSGGATDLAGGSRVQGPGIDAGAIEATPAA
jgi:hypothetical protein